MKPSEALTALSMLSSMVTEMEVRWRSMRVVEDSIRAALDAGKINLIEAGQRAADIIVEERGEPKEVVPPVADTATKPDDAPYGRRADGAPKARPGRKAKGAPAVNLSPGETDEAKAPVDETKNAADLRIIKDVLTTNGPCPPSVLLHRSGLDADTIGAHVRAAAVIESYDGEYALEGGKPMPSIMIRLISQRPS